MIAWHPLDPLAADEFAAVAAILRRDTDVADGWRIRVGRTGRTGQGRTARIRRSGHPPQRRATVICLERATNTTYKGVVSLTDDRVESFTHLPGVQANFTVDEFAECDRMLRSHPDLIAALARRGITDLDLVFMDTWTYGNAVAPPEFRDRRIGWSDTWLRGAPVRTPTRT